MLYRMENTKVCTHCGKDLPLHKFKIAWAGFNLTKKWNGPGFAEANPAKIRRNRCAACDSKSELAKLKLEFMRAFDFKCQCCGEDHPAFLTLDHVNNDGGEHRRSINCQQIMRQARREKFDRAKWNCLCMNCNFSKGHYGSCPHQLGVTRDMAITELEQRSRRLGRGEVNYDPTSWFKPGSDERRKNGTEKGLKSWKTRRANERRLAGKTRESRVLDVLPAQRHPHELG